MSVWLGVTLISTIGWLVSLGFSRSAARRHLILSATLAACWLLPVAISIRTGTAWSLLTINRTVTLPETERREDQRTEGDRPEARDTIPATGEHSAASVFDDEAEWKSEPLSLVQESSSKSVSDKPPARSWNLFPGAISVRQVGILMYLCVSGVMLLRMFFGLVTLQRLRRKGIPVKSLQGETLQGGIEILETEVAVPLAVGFGKPTILLPHGFRESIPPEELHDVLTHEAEHLRRGDHWMILIQRVTAALYWPIVTVHLLNRELSRAREELCDNRVLAGRDPVAYGQTLLSVAERISSPESFLTGIAPGIIGRGELERRVAGLLDGNRDRRTSIGKQFRWFVAAGLLSATALGGTTRVVVVAVEPQASDSKASEAEVDSSVSQKESQAEPITWTGIPLVDQEHPTLHRGVVLGPEGKPLSGASIYATSTIELLERSDEERVVPADLGEVRAVTDDQGRFQFTAEDLSWTTTAGIRKRRETLLVATKEGYVSGWIEEWGEDRNFRSHWNPHPTKQLAIRMRTPATLSGTFTLQEGGALAGARIRVVGLMAPVKYDLDQHISSEETAPLGLFSGVDYADQIYRPTVLPGLTTIATTNGEGSFELPGLPEGFIADLEVTHPKAVTTSLRAAVRPIETVFRAPSTQNQKPTISLYGSGFTAELEKGTVLRGEVFSRQALTAPRKKAVGVVVGQANHNARHGISGPRFTTDAEGRFEVTGLTNRPEGYELAFVGTFDAPYAGLRQHFFPGAEGVLQLQPAVPYRLKLTDSHGNPIDREVSSTKVQQTPGEVRKDVKWEFNLAERVGPGLYQGILPEGPSAVLVKRGAKTDRPVFVQPKKVFAGSRSDWTLEEERYAYGDAWRIARPAVITTDNLYAGNNPTVDQLDLAAVHFRNAMGNGEVINLEATIHSDPPVKVTLVDEAGEPVEHAQLKRQLMRYNGEDLPAAIEVYGLHPERAELLVFEQQERGLIGTLSATWTDQPIRVVMRPAATIRGRFVDAKSGEPNFDFGARVMSEGMLPDLMVAGRIYQTTETPGTRKGEFLLTVSPGVEIKGEYARKNADWKTRPPVGIAFGPLTPKPGEVIDLGDLVVP